MLYEQCLIRNFIDESELESLENLLHYANNADLGMENRFVIFSILEDNKYIGCLIGDWYKNSNSAFIEYICVNEEYRNNGYSNSLLQRFYEWIKDNDTVVFSEYSMKNDTNYKTNRDHCAISYWNYKNFNVLDFEYIQPPLSEDKQPSYDLYLLCNKNKLDKETLLNFLQDFHKYSINTKNNNVNEYYLKMCDDLKNVTFLSFLKVV